MVTIRKASNGRAGSATSEVLVGARPWNKLVESSKQRGSTVLGLCERANLNRKGESRIKRTGLLIGILERTPKSYQGPVLWAWPGVAGFYSPQQAGCDGVAVGIAVGVVRELTT